MKQDGERGSLVGAFIVVEGDEVLAIKQSGQVTRSAIDEHLRPTGRDTKGVRFVGVNERDSVVVVARSVERAPEIEEAVEEAVEAAGEAGDSGSAATDATIESGAPVDGGSDPTDETDAPSTDDPENEES